MSGAPVSPPPREDDEPGESSGGLPPVGDWVRAIAGGIKDTWGDVLREGRAGAERTHDKKWAKFEAKRKRGR